MDKELKILIVDDEPDIRFLVSSILKRQYKKARIITAKSVQTGLEQIQSIKFDIFFFDNRLGDGTGFDLLHQVKKTYLETQPIIIFMSAYTSAPDLDKFAEKGINSFIPKPLDRNKILQTLQRFATIKSL